MTPIETRYGGHLFRSRLEARWAAFFDLIGWRWTYEPFDADGYIPDFVIHGGRPLLVEVKPASLLTEYLSHVDRLEVTLATHWAGDVLIAGTTPAAHLPNNYGWDAYATAGVLGEPADDRRSWSLAKWVCCGRCGGAAVFHDEGCWTCRPCGEYAGDNLIREGITADRIEATWGIAHEFTRWVSGSTVARDEQRWPTALRGR